METGPKRITSICCVLFLLMGFIGNAQTTVTLGTGVTQSGEDENMGPVNGYYAYMRYQVVYTAAEIIAAGGSVGTITQFGWNVATVPDAGEVPGYKIRMANTTATDSETHNGDELTEVFSGDFTPTVGYNMFTLTTPFLWDGVSNLLVDVCYGPVDYADEVSLGRVFTYGTIEGSSGSRYARNDFSDRCDVETSVINPFKPQAQFVLDPPPACLMPAGLQSSLITKNSATVSWTEPVNAPSGGYLYYKSETNTAPLDDTEETGSVLAGETSVDFSGLIPSTSYYVWVRSNCDGDGLSTWMGPLVFSTLCDYDDILTTTGGAVCGQGTPELSATIGAGGILSWYAAQTGGTLLGRGETFTTPLITENTNFYVSGGRVIADSNVSVGEGASTSGSSGDSPYYNGYGGYKLQSIIKASELQAAGIFPGPINSIGYTVTYAGENAYNDFALSIGTTTQDEATTSHIGDLTPVYSNASQTVTLGLNVYTFDTPFEWDGTSNIVIQTCYSNENDGGESSEVEYDSLDFESCTYSYADDVSAEDICSLVTGKVSPEANGGTYTSNTRPKIVFNATAICESSRVEVLATIDTAPVLTLSEAAAVCTGETTALVTITAGGADYDTYEWTPSTGVSGDSATGWAFNPEVSTVYTLTATQTDGSMCATTVPLQITIMTPPSGVVVTPASTSVCEGTTQMLTVSNSTNVALGTGTTAPGTTSWPNPFSAWYGGVKTQMLYTEAELLAQGLTIGADISSLSFNFSTSVASACNDLRIKMGSSTNVSMTAGFVASSTLTTVYNASYTPVAGTTGLVAFPLTTNYVYEGGNLIVELVHNQGNGGNGSGTTTKTSTTPFVSVCSGARDNVTNGLTGFDALTSYSSGGTYSIRPNIVFSYNKDYAVVWSPAEELFTDEEGTIAYTGQDITSVYAKPTANATYTVTVTNEAGCETVKTASVIVKTTTPPTVPAETQTLCGSATVANLVAVGTVIKWYAEAEGGTPLVATTALEDGKTYYASQRVAGCESVLRTPLMVELTMVDAPTVADDAQGFCNAGTVADLLPNDASIKWYNASTGGTALAATVALASGEYFATQTVDGCESIARTQVTVTINETAKPEGNATQLFCGTGTVGDLDVTGDGIIWYDAETEGNVLTADAALADGNIYYASQSIEGCESLTRLAVTVTLSTVTVDNMDNVSECSEYILPALTNGVYYTETNGGGDQLTAGDSVTETATIYIYAVAAANPECIAESSFVVTIANVPAPTGDDTQTIEGGVAADVTIEDLVADLETGGTITWYNTLEDALARENAITAGTQLTQGEDYYGIQTLGDCTSVTAFKVTVEVVLARDTFNLNAFMYHPNPVKDVLNISYSSDITSVTVFNILGQQVIDKQPNAAEVKLDMSSLADGAYIVNVAAGSAVKTIKVIKKQ